MIGRSFLTIVFICGFPANCLGKGQNVQNLSTKPIRENEECCEELRIENIERKMETDMLNQRLDEEIMNRKQAMAEELDSRTQAETQLKFDILHAVPLGTILPWVNKPSKDSSHQEDLPKGFAICDGSIITEGIWIGQTLPDLTNGRFLRGGTFSNVLELEEDMMLEHTHNDPGHSHFDTGHSHSDAGHSHIYGDIYSYVVPSFGYGYGETYYRAENTETSKTSENAYCNILEGKASITASKTGMGGVNGTNVGDQIRPRNMKTIFIMKIVA